MADGTKTTRTAEQRNFGRNHGDEAEQPMPERGQRIGDRDDANGRSAIARADEAKRAPPLDQQRGSEQRWYTVNQTRRKM